MGVADFGTQQWAGIMFGIGTLPDNFYVALCTDEPGDGWDGAAVAIVEPVDTAYARRPLAKNSGWALSDGGTVINASTIDYGVPLASWGIITHYAVLDAPYPNGNLWFWAAFAEAMVIPAGYPLSIGPGSLTISVDDQVPTIVEA